MSYAGRKVLVTGADGFIGSHLVEALVRAGADVRALCLYTSMGSRGWLEQEESKFSERVEFLLGDIRDRGFVEKACDGIEIVFHLAALIAIPYSYVAPSSFVETNVTGTLNVLEAVRRQGCGRLIHTSTSEVYGTPESIPIRETHALKAQSPYAASKIAADKLCESYHCSFGTPVTILRPFNTYGPRQSARAVIPTILEQLLRGKNRIELGNLTPRRDLTFVDDTVRGFLAAGVASSIEGRTLHLGTGRAVSVAELFEEACRAVEVEAEVVSRPERHRPTLSEVMVLQSDSSLARELLGWSSTTSLEEGLRVTATWMRTRLHKYRDGYHAV